MIYLANIEESDLGKEDNRYVQEVKKYAQKKNPLLLFYVLK